MLVDIPDAKEFYDSGFSYTMLAMSQLIDLILEFQQTTFDDEEEYWSEVRSTLTSSATMAHQGIDFLMKSKIAEVSSLLLIQINPDKLPKNDKNGDVSFADFHVHDSSSLPKILSKFCKHQLPDKFFTLYEKMRTRRNKIAHTIDRRLKVQADELIKETISVLELFTSKRWNEIRETYHENSPGWSRYWDTESENLRRLEEYQLLFEYLNNSEFEKSFGVKKSRRFYYCPNCTTYDNYEMEIRTATLEPNTSKSTSVTCAACMKSFAVHRTNCQATPCPSNVIYDNNCLTCFESQE